MKEAKKPRRVKVSYQFTAEHAARLPGLTDRLAVVLRLPYLSLNDTLMVGMDLLEQWVEIQEAKKDEQRAEVAQLAEPELPPRVPAGRPRKAREEAQGEPAEGAAPKKRGRPRKGG